MKSHFLNNLENIDFLEGKWARCNNPLGFYSQRYDITVCSPPGFITDFASVPRIPFAYLLAGNTNHWEALLHDMMYRFFEQRIMADMIFFESSQARSSMRENQHLLYKTGRFVRSSLMTGAVLSIGWTSHHPLPGCLDYRNKKTCGQNCFECDKYYPAWFLCKMDGYKPEILDIHGAD